MGVCFIEAIKGHGGLKATVNDLHAALPDYSYVMKTDVKRYYESIDHTILLRQLDKDIADPFIWSLLVQFVKRTVAKGARLSPLLVVYREAAPYPRLLWRTI